jgi:hypothetical protein
VQQQPGNVVISIRIDSPGDGGAIDQSNTAVGQADAANTAATSQGAGGAESSLSSATQQAAAALASALQQQPRNVVISIRINSPGNDGPINQANTAVANAGSANTSNTAQGAAGGAAAGDDAALDGAAPDTADTSGASATQPAASNTDPPASAAARAAPAAADTRARPRPDTERRREPASATASATTPTAPASVSHTSEAATAVQAPAARPVVQSSVAPRTHHATRASFGQRVYSGAARAAASVPQDAARVLGNFDSASTAGLQGEHGQDVSSAVVFTLFAVMLAAALFLGRSHLPATPRLRGWLRL